MDSNYPLLALPLWFGTPWHGFVYRVGGVSYLRPNGSTGELDRPWSGGMLRDSALWDIGKPDPVTPAELLEQGGKFLGRSLVSPALNTWRPVLLDGVVCRARIQESYEKGFTLELRAFDPDTGRLGSPVSADTGRFSMDDIGQGAGEPPVVGWTPPALIRSYTGLDVTADGRSMLLAVTPYIKGLPFTPILGLVRLDIGGTPDQPTLTLHLVASRANALGTLSESRDRSAQSNEWNRKPTVYEYDKCGIRRVTQEGARYPSPTTHLPSIDIDGIYTRTGYDIHNKSFSGRIMGAWFEPDGGVHILRYSCTSSSIHTVTAEDMSTGVEVDTYSYDDSCRMTGSAHEGKIVERFRVVSNIFAEFRLQIGDVSETATYSRTIEVIWDGGFVQTTHRVTEVGTIGGVSEQYTDDSVPLSPEWVPPEPPPPPELIHSFYSSTWAPGLPRDMAMHPSQAGWKAPALAVTKALTNAVEVHLRPAQTPVGPRGGTVSFTFFPGPYLTPSEAVTRGIAAGNGAFNPITGEVLRGGPGTVMGCI